MQRFRGELTIVDSRGGGGDENESRNANAGGGRDLDDEIPF